MNFHETVMGKRFYEDTMPRLVHELEKLNEKTTYEEEIIPFHLYDEYNSRGWRYKDSINADETYLVVVRNA